MSAARHSSSSETTPALNLSEKRKVTMPIALFIAICSAIVSVALGYQRIQTNADLETKERQALAAHLAEERATLTIQINEHAERIQNLERAIGDVPVIKNDVRWIRETLERDRSRLTTSHIGP